MNENQIVIGLLAGLLPYRIVSIHMPYGFHLLHLQAMFWDLTIVKRCRGISAWQVNIPLIKKMRGMVNAVLTQLRDKNQQ